MEVMAVKVIEGVISQQGMEWIGLTQLPKSYGQLLPDLGHDGLEPRT